MRYKRADRVASVIHEKIGEMMIRELKDPALHQVTITKVKVSDDVRHAKIYYSVYGDQQKKQNAAKAFDRAKGYIRSEIGAVLTLRFVPTITFCYDDSIEYADHIERLIKKLHEETS
ncbi:MAG: 30S ribosome-binding factor RbfA [candidate division KSB1 bacterium]|nr:30S ribosome-binding factor RbfA [candidate division KSB1 bacterium]MDZ7346321.1 30S ribosome-binding factor RbfA [candidate division KSB1 bacterium]